MSVVNETPETPTEESGEIKPLLVVDLQKPQSKKRIKGLRKGRGKLMTKIQDMLGDMREGGMIESDAQPVVIIVQQKDEEIDVRKMFRW